MLLLSHLDGDPHCYVITCREDFCSKEEAEMLG